MTKKISSPTIIVDTREQRPFDLTFAGVPIVTGTLSTGDYSLQGHEAAGIAIERKSLPDLFGCCGASRERFEREIIRLAEFRFAAIVIEGDLYQIARTPPGHTQMKPRSVLSSIVAWQVRHRVHFVPCPNRAFAARITWRLLERYWRDTTEGKI